MGKEKVISIFLLSIFLALTPIVQALGEAWNQENQIVYVDWLRKILFPFTHSIFSLAPPGSTEVYLGSVQSSKCFSSQQYPITLSCGCDSVWEPYCSAGTYYCRVDMGPGDSSRNCEKPTSWWFVTEIRAGETYTLTYQYPNACGQCWMLEYIGWKSTTTTTTTTTTIIPYYDYKTPPYSGCVFHCGTYYSGGVIINYYWDCGSKGQFGGYCPTGYYCSGSTCSPITTTTTTTTPTTTTTTTIPTCNNNGVCEPAKGENPSNCPGDCTVQGTLTLTFIGLLAVLMVLIIYLLPKI